MSSTTTYLSPGDDLRRPQVQPLVTQSTVDYSCKETSRYKAYPWLLFGLIISIILLILFIVLYSMSKKGKKSSSKTGKTGKGTSGSGLF